MKYGLGIVFLLAFLAGCSNEGPQDTDTNCDTPADASTNGDRYIIDGPNYPHAVEMGTEKPPSMACSWTPTVGLDDPSSCTPMASPTETTSYLLTVTTACDKKSAASTVHVLKELFQAGDQTFKIKDSSGKIQTVYTGYRPNQLRYLRSQTRLFDGKMAPPTPTEYDPRPKTAAIIRDQGSCGSCWWFGTKGLLEYLVRQGDKKDIEISGQYGVDCSPRFSGCGGGDFNFKDKLLPPKGAVYESEYPIKYQAANRTCQTKWLDEGHYHEPALNWGYLKDRPSVEEMQLAILEYGGIGVTVGAGGLSPDSKGWVTSCGQPATNHIVYVIGWLEGSLHGYPAGPYWIMVNSWGKNVADRGIYYVRARVNGTYCSSLGLEEVVWAGYKTACEPQPHADGGNDYTILQIPGTPQSVKIGTVGLTGHSYLWDHGDTLSSNSIAQPVATPIKTTTYTVKATTACGSATSKLTVHVYKDVKGKRVEVR